MGQAAVDLPDPLSAAPVSSGNTDDLLAQLAGEEIERLLAEADEPKGQAPSAEQPLEFEPTPTASSQSPVASVVEAPTANPAGSAVPKEEVELNALFTQLEGSASPPPEVGEKPASAPAVEEPSAADALAEEMLEDAAVSGRAALANGAVPASVPSSETERHTGESTSLLIRLLEWMNRPLDCCSDQTRDLIGKIAILTTVNAGAVLAYVIIFRHH